MLIKKEGKYEKIKSFSGEQSLTQNICPKAQNKEKIGTNQQRQTKTEKKQQIRSKFVTEILNRSWKKITPSLIEDKKVRII